MEVRDEIGAHVKTVSMIGVTVIVTLIAYLAVVEVVRAAFKPFQGFAATSHTRELRFAFYGLAILAVLMIRFLRQALLKRFPGGDRPAGVHRLERASLVTMILSEIPGILGLVLFLLFGLNVDFYILLFVSFFLVFMYFPRRQSWEEWLKG